MIASIFIIWILYAICKDIGRKPRKILKATSVKYDFTSSMEKDLAKKEREAERERAKQAKLRQAKEQAQAELDGIDALRKHYFELIDALQEEKADPTTTARRRNSIETQLISLEEKIIKLDTRRAKAFATANAA